MTTPDSGNEQWERPPFMPPAPYDASLPTEQPVPHTAGNKPPQKPQEWYRRPWIIAAGVVAGLVAGYTLNGPHPADTDPVLAPSASATPLETGTPVATPAVSPKPTQTVTITAEPSPTTSPQPTTQETESPDDFLFVSNGDSGGTLSGPAVTWDEGYRNVISFACKDSTATAVLSVHDERGEAVKTYDKTKLSGPLFRLCAGNKVSGKVSKHPERYFRAALAAIIAKNV